MAPWATYLQESLRCLEKQLVENPRNSHYGWYRKGGISRDRLRLELGWMGYGALSEATWISPYDRTREVKNLLQRLNIEEYVHIFSAKHQGSTDPSRLVSRCWDLGKIHQKYADFLTEYRPKLEGT